MSNLSDLKAAGGSGKSIKLVASGTLPNGIPVVLKSDGTVEAITGSGSGATIPSGSLALFENASTGFISIDFDPTSSSKFVLAYIDNGNSERGTVVMGTVSGNTLTFGTPVVFNSASYGMTTQVAFDPNTSGKFVVAYMANFGIGNVCVGTYSGTTITMGTPVVFQASFTSYLSLTFDPNAANIFVIAYRSDDNSNYGTAVVGTVSGTTASFGSNLVFKSAASTHIALAADPNTANKFVVSYKATNGYSVVLTRSSTSLSSGTESAFISASASHISTKYDPNTANKFLVVWANSATSYLSAIVGNISGTTITWGTSVAITALHSTITDLSFDPNLTNSVILSYINSSASPATVMAAQLSLSGTVVTFETPIVVKSTASSNLVVGHDSTQTGKFIQAFTDTSDSSKGRAITSQASTLVTNLTSTNFIGTSEGAFADTATATVMLRGGITTTQSGLTTGSTYYVQADGTLSTTADSPSVVAGQALSATTLLIEGET